MKHVVNVSGGRASWYAAELVAEECGTRDLWLVFADVFTESAGLYRFLVESSASALRLKGKRLRLARRFARRAERVPPLSLAEGGMARRKAFLRKLAADVHSVMPRLVWISEGRTPWEVFRDERFIGNSRVDPCSKLLKRNFVDAYVESHFTPADAIRYFGLDANEEHRLVKLQERLAGWTVRSPLIERDIFKEYLRGEAERRGLRSSDSYALGFPTDNCGGACVKAGQGQWGMLLAKRPEVYAFAEGEEQACFTHIGRSDIGVLRDRTGGITKRVSLKTFRERLQAGGAFDRFELGGCGCAV
jgi:hypothetical protein